MTYTPAGKIPIGGSIEIVMPDLNVGTGVQEGWEFIGTPATTWSAPAAGAAAEQSSTWTTGQRKLVIVTATNAIAAGVQQIMGITNVQTPSSAVAANTVSVTTKDSSGIVIDGIVCHSD